jgi:hypothetical protein
MEEIMEARCQPIRRRTTALIISILFTVFLFSAFSTNNLSIVHADQLKAGTPAPDVTEPPVSAETETGSQPDPLGTGGPIIVDYSPGELEQGLQEAIDAFLRQNTDQLHTSVRQFTPTVIYQDEAGIYHIRLFPTEVYESNWELPYAESDVISLVAELIDGIDWQVAFESPQPLELPELGTDDIGTLAVPEYSFPWTGGHTWKKTQGFHGTTWKALDFSPASNTVLNVLAIESGQFEPVCYKSSDPYQAMVRVVHNNGADISRYLHLAKSSVPSAKFNIQIPKGQIIGSLYTGSAKVSPAPAACTDLSNYKYYTPCGCGYGTHLHFESNNLITIQGHSLSSISSAAAYTSYTSNNGTNSLAAPTNVSATDGTYEDRTVITWTGVSGATSYEVWRHTSNNSGGAARLSSNATTPFNDSGGSLGKPYYYWVKACNSSGCSNFSNTDTGYRQTPGVTLLYAPALTPSAATCDNYWKVATLGYQGTNAYLTVNTNQSSLSTNSGIWQPTLPTTGTYKVEAYIGAASTSSCSGTMAGGYTSNAKYTVYHATGTTTVTKDQKASVGAWLDLGTFTFNAGNAGKVKLTDLNSEANFSRIVFFNAMKFTRIELPPAAFDRVSPANAATQVELSPTLTWSASSTAIDYDYCIDTTNDNACSNWISAGTNTSVALSDLSPNTQYYWHVRSENAGGATYANGNASAFWTFTTQPIQTDDNYEENDSFNKAYDLSALDNTWLSTVNGFGIQADEDWYRINVTPGYQRVLVDVRFTHSAGDIDVELYDATGTWLASSSSIEDNEFLSYRAASAGTYYINVTYGNQGNQYDLWWDNVLSSAGIDIHVGGDWQGSYTVDVSQSTRASYTGLSAGPVKISSPSNIPIMAAERVIYRVNGVDTSFTEMMGLPNKLLDTVYWLPWYNNVELDTQLRFANVSDSTATVRIYIGGQEMEGSPFTMEAGASTRKSFVGVNAGPVKIESDVNIVAAERVIYKAAGGLNTSFSEMMGLSSRQVDTTYWLPWYNNVELDTQLRFANVSGSTATVHVYIGKQEMQGSPFTLLPGGSTRKSFAGVNAGPVQIVSDNGVPIVAAERVVYKVNGVDASFTEMMALPNNQLSKTYWLPWYNNRDLDTQLRFANVSGSTATVRVFIGGQEMQGSPFTLEAGASTRKSFPDVSAGPVQIVSDQMIIAAERVVHQVNGDKVSFSEMMGLPDGQLDTVYWLPWYNNATADLDTQLRFGVP